jgi:hypothetical protein
MAQTTSATSAKDAYVEFSTNGSSWTNCSGTANMISPGGGERKTEETDTFEGDTPIITRGKRGGQKTKFRAVYTEGASEISVIARTAYLNGTDFYLRWAPKGNTAGNIRYTTSAGTVLGGVFPEVDATKAEALIVEVELHYAELTPAAIP